LLGQHQRCFSGIEKNVAAVLKGSHGLVLVPGRIHEPCTPKQKWKPSFPLGVAAAVAIAEQLLRQFAVLFSMRIRALNTGRHKKYMRRVKEGRRSHDSHIT